jgi:hypothetical protein
MPPKRSVALALTLLLKICQTALCEPCLVITELCKNPYGNESACPGGDCLEYIEFVNCGCDSIDLAGAFITDGRTSDSIVAWDKAPDGHEDCTAGALVLAPGQIGLILDSEYDSLDNKARLAISPGALLATVGKADILSGLALHDGVLLYRGDTFSVAESLAAATDPGRAADPRAPIVHTTPAGVPEGFSLIPRTLFAPTDWIPCPDSLSPGRLEWMDEGLCFDYSIRPDADRRNAMVTCWFFGIPSIESRCDWALYWGAPGVSLAHDGIEGACPGSILVNAPVDTVLYRIELSGGRRFWSRAIDFSTVTAPTRSLLIRELFPRATDRIPEWFEIQNVSSIPVSMQYWRYGDPLDPDTLTTIPLLIEPGGYAVITRDAAALSRAYGLSGSVHIIEPRRWPALGNYSDTVRLWNAFDPKPVDRVCYRDDWLREWDWQSLDRIDGAGGCDSLSWAVASRPTPGFVNTYDRTREISKPALTVGPIPFTPNGDGIDDLLRIEAVCPVRTRAEVAIYSFDGRMVVQFETHGNEPYVWNGNTRRGDPAPNGPFFVVAAFDGPNGQSVIRNKGVLWR